MKKFEAGERVQFIDGNEMKTGKVLETWTEAIGKAYQVETNEGNIYFLGEGRITNLDQPKPVKVPKFVAEWIEECKENSTLYECMSGSYVDKDEIQEWHYIADEDWAQYEGHRELVARAWLDGYVVEEEPKYYVKLPEPFGYLRRSKLHPTTYDVREASKYTKQEIKELDERYWAFAVPVEEVEAE